MSQENYSVSLDDLDLPFDASGIMAYNTPAIVQKGKQLIVGYLADDQDCESPLESCDGQGSIHTAHRLAHDHAEMQEALALDSEWEPDLGLLDDHLDQLRKPWIEAATKAVEFQVWADKTAGHGARFNEAYYARRAAKFWRETGGEFIYGEGIDMFGFTEDVRVAVWNELRDLGVIGNPDAVLLDCYDHGGQVWSISGQGMQCRWDTASGAGVWVPDDCAKEEVTRRAAVYAFGVINDNGSWTVRSGRKRFYAALDSEYGGEHSPQFEHWYEAFEWLEAKTLNLKLPRRKAERQAAVAVGRSRAATEVAEGVLSEFNDWLMGSTYGIVQATFENEGTQDDPDWTLIASEECWGFIGCEYAMEEITAQVNNLGSEAA